MGQRILWRDVVANGTASMPNGAATGFPAANFQRPSLSSKAKSDGGDATDIWTVDLGATQNLDSFFIGGHDFINTDTLTFRYASDSGFSAGVGTVSPTWHENILIEFFTSVARRYIRLECAKVTASETRQIGVFMAGAHYHFENRLLKDDFIGVGPDTAKLTRTEGGILYGDVGVAMSEQSGRLLVNSTEKVELETLRATYQTVMPFVSASDYSNNPVTETVYGTFSAPIRTPQAVGKTDWYYDWRMIEQK